MGHAHAIDVSQGNARVSGDALTLETVRATRSLGLGRELLQAVLGVDARAVERLLACEAGLVPGTPEGERALLLVRLHRALGDVFGSLEAVHGWLDTPQPALDARPIELMRTPEGLERVVRHMETRCKDCLW
ncbi:antitoxin Xre/MbcA/ParS toxin-binding domain-containing protein [Lysobacter humi (ex Lee et al. 2017)]